MKYKVYKAIIFSTLLYGAETWTVYRTRVKKLNVYVLLHLREIVKITWKDGVLNDEIYRRNGLAPKTDLLIERNLRWTGHIHHMDAERLSRQLLYSQLSSGARNRGRTRLSCKDVGKRSLKLSYISLILGRLELKNRKSGKS